MSIKKLLLLLIVSASVYGQDDFINEETLRVKNNISERLTYVFQLNSNDSILTDKDVYDDKGKYIKDLRYDDKGEVRYNYIIEYNENGLMIKQTGYDYGEISTILTYKYDKQNNRTENFQHKPDGTLLIHQKRVYDSDNLNTELFNKNVKNNTFFLSYKYFYGDNKLYSKTERYLENGEIVSTTIYDYNQEENSIALYEDKKKKNNLFLTKQYNTLNQLTEKTFLNANKRIEYKYDIEGNLIEEITFINDAIDSRKKYHYKKSST